MKTVRIQTRPLPLADDPSPLELANHLAARMFGITRGALFGRWDDAAGSGLWFGSKDTRAIFEPPSVDEILFKETVRSRFRSVVFRLGSLAAENEGDLCGVVQLLSENPQVNPGPPRRYAVHASFEPAAGLWFKAAVLPLE